MEGSMMFTVISTVLTLVGLWYLVFWRYRTYRVDFFRQEMFDLRDDLFDAANSGLIDFEHPAYGMLRDTINGFIRFGHRFTLGQFVFMMVLIKEKDLEEVSDFDEEWELAIEGLQPEVKTQLAQFRIRMDRIAIKQLVIGTPEFYWIYPVVLVSLVAYLVGRLATQQTASIWAFAREKMFPEIDNAAYFYGRNDSPLQLRRIVSH